MSEKKKRAADALVYYFRTAFTRAQIAWTSDHEAEVRGIVDDIIQAAIEP